MDWLDWFRDVMGEASGYKQAYNACVVTRDGAEGELKLCERTMDAASYRIGQLEEMTREFGAAPPPEITYIQHRSSLWVQQQINKLDLGIIRCPLDREHHSLTIPQTILPPGQAPDTTLVEPYSYRMTNRSSMINIIAWSWIDKWEYVKHLRDCENFAFAFMVHVNQYFNLNQVGVVMDFSSRHSYNLIVFPDGTIWLLEPQHDHLFLWSERLTEFYQLIGAILVL